MQNHSEAVVHDFFAEGETYKRPRQDAAKSSGVPEAHDAPEVNPAPGSEPRTWLLGLRVEPTTASSLVHKSRTRRLLHA